jgi:hypothetical protein
MFVICNWVVVWDRDNSAYSDVMKWKRDVKQYFNMFCFIRETSTEFKDDVRVITGELCGNCNFTTRICDIFK